VRVHDAVGAAPYGAEKMGKATLWRSDALLVGVNAFEPGQRHAAHAHEGQDKVYVVLQGRGRFTVGDETADAGPGHVVIAPAGVPHAVENASPDRLLLLVALAPAP
jgi:quercetin dioxygenase-like cupin family protein